MMYIAGNITCFANPIHISIQFPFKLLLTTKLEKGLPILHTFSLFGKFSESKKVKTFNKPDNIEANQAADMKPANIIPFLKKCALNECECSLF